MGTLSKNTITTIIIVFIVVMIILTHLGVEHRRKARATDGGLSFFHTDSPLLLFLLPPCVTTITRSSLHIYLSLCKCAHGHIDAMNIRSTRSTSRHAPDVPSPKAAHITRPSLHKRRDYLPGSVIVWRSTDTSQVSLLDTPDTLINKGTKLSFLLSLWFSNNYSISFQTHNWIVSIPDVALKLI